MSEMVNRIREKAQSLLAEGKADAILCLTRDSFDVVQPRLCRTAGELASLAIEPKWNLAKLAMQLLRAAEGSFRLAVVCRGCDERALTELGKRNQFDPARMIPLAFACSADQARACLCTRPYPENPVAGEKVSGVDPFADPRLAGLLTGDDAERMERWTGLLSRCLKCYGCRNACPICVCSPCKLEDDLWVEKAAVPTELISYHLIRAFHLADSCVACGACQDACPVGIPLAALQLVMRRRLAERYGYEPGMEPDRKSPLLMNFDQAQPADLTLPAWTVSTGGAHER
jgi:formate hydrogenlyase subunit 6/NADH:ubiquinone oxidoreductase subunit I